MISVCMATYNGEKTIKRQLSSIIPQLTATDEIIIVDDDSSDSTISIIQSMRGSSKAPIRIVINEKNEGPIKSFEHALELAKGDGILFSDQDDQWYSNKVYMMQQAFKTGADLIVHDAKVVDGDLNLIDESWNSYNNNDLPQTIMSNIVKNGITGAMMGISKKLKNQALPFPKNIEMHDQWIFLVAKKNHDKLVEIKTPLMNYVRHGDNATGMHKRSKKDQLNGRWRMLKYIWSYQKK